MLAIVNVSPDDAPLTGRNQYEVRINRRVIATFEHDRQPDGAAQCLRDAADAVDRCREEDRVALLEALMRMTPNDKVQAAPCLQGVAPATQGYASEDEK